MPKDQIVLGYNGFSRSETLFAHLYNRQGRDRYRVLGHDASAALFINGQLIAAAEEERFTREKKTSAFPKNAIAYCLAHANISLAQVDTFAFPWNFDNQAVTQLLVGHLSSLNQIESKFLFVEKFKHLYDAMLSPQSIINDFNESMQTQMPSEQFVFVPHHLSHLLCGYYLSGFRESAFLVSDGRGESLSSVMGEINQDGFTIFHEADIRIQDSIGLNYSKLTRYLGFTPNNDEYKIMGLSSFVPPGQVPSLMGKFIELKAAGRYESRIENNLTDSQEYYPLLDDFFKKDAVADEWQFKKQVARSIQDALEAVTTHQIRYLEEKTEAPHLILEGGVALNCVNNTQVLEGSKFQDAFVSFGASDVGVCIGAGYFPFFTSKIHRPHTPTAYLGPQYDDATCQKILETLQSKVDFHAYEEDELLSHVVSLLRQKKVMGWFQGRMEFGPRALGNRSILADPSFEDIQDVINIKVKKREVFRPFAPVVLQSEAATLFELGKKRDSPYMTFAFATKEGFKSLIRGAIHVDGTARIQTVTEEQNHKLWKLLKRFHAETSIPCLINTSFNVQGEPIVCTPQDALDCFLGTEIDILVLNNFVITKRESTSPRQTIT